MRPQLVISFAGDAADTKLVHRVRNFGEDLHRAFETRDDAAISLDEVDVATNELRVTVKSVSKVRRVAQFLEQVLGDHGFEGAAQIRAAGRTA